MKLHRDTVCDDAPRRSKLEESLTLHGIDYLEVQTSPKPKNQRVLHVFFIEKTKAAGRTALGALLDDLAGSPGLVRIKGGVRRRNVRVTSVKRDGLKLLVEVDEPGDFSRYTLTLRDDAGRLDPEYDEVEFSFKAGCPSRFDCKPTEACIDDFPAAPRIDYLAKDYASFRQALLDFAPTILPQWKERHEADLQMTLLELLAHAGDHLSYYQDAVANEAYLETARQRISVRRHARLIDYRMHDGASARVFVHLKASDAVTVPRGTRVLSRVASPIGSFTPPYDALLDWTEARAFEEAADVVFETMDEAKLDPRLNVVSIYTWMGRECCLPRGATTADLKGDLSGVLGIGDFLLFEERVGPETGVEGDADPSHRQVVRVTGLEVVTDPLAAGPQQVTRVRWDERDALAFAACLRTGEGDDEIEDVTVARGNLVLATHGRTVALERHPGPEAPPSERLRLAHRVRLDEGPLSFCVPVPPPDAHGRLAPAALLLAQDPRTATPQVTARVRTSTGDVTDWDGLPHLLDARPTTRSFAVETDNEGRAVLRFGDDEFGRAPEDGSVIDATYRVGIGTQGNVGADALAHLLPPAKVLQKADGSRDTVGEALEMMIAAAALADVTLVRNPLPAWGGMDPEPMERVKRIAPPLMRATTFRAVTEADYARFAEQHPSVSKAVATFRATRSWTTVFVAVDPKGRVELEEGTRAGVLAWMRRFTQAGYDLSIRPPVYVPLDVEVSVCADPAHFRADVEARLLDALGTRALPDGRQGFFHPDRFTFGRPLYLSELYAAIEAVPGVDSAEVTRMHRFGKKPAGEIKKGIVKAGRLEVLRLDNDPNAAENGVLRIRVRGGR